MNRTGLRLMPLLIMLLPLIAPAHSVSAWQSTAQQNDKGQGSGLASYEQLVKKAESGDEPIDFTALREAYVKSKRYDPYGGDVADSREMYEALNKEQYDQALKLANEAIKKCYIDIDAHYVSMSVYAKKGDTSNSDRERKILAGLIKSVMASGDGKSAKTSFKVVRLREEYITMSVLGLQVASQSLVHDGGHSYDVLSGNPAEEGKHDSKSDLVRVYFLIDPILGHMENLLKGH